MKPLIRHNIKDLFINNKFILVLNFLIFIFFVGTSIPEARQYHFFFYEFMLMNLVNHYYLISALLPIMLIILARFFKYHRVLELIRFENKRAYIRVEVLSYVSWLVIYISLHLVILSIIGLLNFPLNLTWTDPIAIIQSDMIQLINQYTQTFAHPIFAIVSVSLYIIFGWSVLGSLLSFVNLKWDYKSMLITTGIIVCLTFIGFNTDLDNVLPIVSFNNFYILHHILFATSQSVVKFILVLITGLVILGNVFWPTTCAGKRSSDALIKNFFLPKRYIKWMYYFIVALFFINLAQGIYTLLNTGTYPLIDIFFNMFGGSSVAFRDLFGWTQLTIVMFAPIFLIASRQSHLKIYTGAHLIVRFQNRDVLKRKEIITYSQFLIKYIFIVCIVISSIVLIDYSHINQSIYYEFLELYNLSSNPIVVYIIIIISIAIQVIFNFSCFMILSSRLSETISFVLMVVVSAVVALILPFDMLLFSSGIFSIVNLLANHLWLFYLNLFILSACIALFYSIHLKEVK